MACSRAAKTWAFLIAALLIGAWAGLIRPVDRQRLGLERENAQLRAALALSTAAPAASMTTDVTRLRPAVEQLETRAAHRALAPADTLAELWKLAEADGVLSTDIHFADAPADPKRGAPARIDMKLAGTFANLRRFIFDLEQEPAPRRITALTLTADPSIPAGMQAQMTLWAPVYPGLGGQSR